MIKKAIIRRAILLIHLVLFSFVFPQANANEFNDLTQVDFERGLKVGVGDRLLWYYDNKKQSTVQTLKYMDIHSDMLAIWLPIDWQSSWIDRKELGLLKQQKITPVFIHYYYGDIISKERVIASQDDWLDSIRRMAKLVKSDTSVLIVLEPEFNHGAPDGETPVLSWEGFSDHIEKGLNIIRQEAPNALVAICPGDFSPERNLEKSLGKVAPKLDFIAFQEMRATTDPDKSFFGYKDVGNSAVSYSKYLQKTFNKPILLAYIALSSYGGWEKNQAKMPRVILDDEVANVGLTAEHPVNTIFNRFTKKDTDSFYFVNILRRVRMVMDTERGPPEDFQLICNQIEINLLSEIKRLDNQEDKRKKGKFSITPCSSNSS